MVSLSLLLKLFQDSSLVLSTNAMRGQLTVVQLNFVQEALPSFPFTPRTQHFHNASRSGTVEVEYPTTNTGRMSILTAWMDPTASHDER